MKSYYTKRIVMMVLLVCLIISVVFSKNVLAQTSAEGQNWYIKRNSEHCQPTAAMKFSTLEKYNAYYVDTKHTENTGEKVLYLTFDAGYENGNIKKILDVLKEENTPAAFFILKNMIIKEFDLVKTMIEDGHLVCNHTMNHKDTTAITKEEFLHEVLGLADLYREKTGRELACYYRPPEGRYSEETLQYAKELGYKTIFWSFAYADWDNEAQPNYHTAKEKIMKNIHNGAVLLLHPTSSTNAAILKDLLTELKAEGYRFGTLDELTAAV